MQLAEQVYVYGYPLVYNLHEIDGFANNIASLPFSAPWNEFGYARELLGPETEFVSPNNDTLYVLAACDVRQGPLVLHVPDMAGRYYVLQYVDAWTNNFAYIGRRATGTSEGEFLLAADNWAGEAPVGMRLVSAPTGIFMIVGRVQVDDEADLPAVHAVQDQFTLTPLNIRDGRPAPGMPGAPGPDPRVREDLPWWERLRAALSSFPPPPADARFVEYATRLGAIAVESQYVDPDPALAEALVAGAAAGQWLDRRLRRALWSHRRLHEKAAAVAELELHPKPPPADATSHRTTLVTPARKRQQRRSCNVRLAEPPAKRAMAPRVRTCCLRSVAWR